VQCAVNGARFTHWEEAYACLLFHLSTFFVFICNCVLCADDVLQVVAMLVSFHLHARLSFHWVEFACLCDPLYIYGVSRQQLCASYFRGWPISCDG
jgi:hypothetical protein